MKILSQKLILASSILSFGLLLFGCQATNQPDQTIQPNSNAQSMDDVDVGDAADITNNSNLREGIKEPAFANIPSDLLKKEKNITPPVSDGFVLVQSLLSHNDKLLVFSEISECISDLNNYPADSVKWANCEWSYSVFTLNVQTREKKQIYSRPSVARTSRFFTPIAQAGGCQLIYLPIAWSKNDAKIILQWANPTICGSESVPEYKFYSINTNGGDLVDLATFGALFFDDFSQVVFVKHNPSSPNICGPDRSNYGQVILYDLIAETTRVLLNESDVSYKLLAFDDTDPNLLRYKEFPIYRSSGCGLIDEETQNAKELKIDS